MNDVASALPAITHQVMLLSRSELLDSALRHHLGDQPAYRVHRSGHLRGNVGEVDLALVDAGSYGQDECLDLIRQLGDVPVGLINASDDKARRLLELRPSIRGVFRPATSRATFVRGVRTLIAGGDWLPRPLMEKLIHRYRQLTRTSQAIEALTLRERQIMQLAGKGLSNAAIAAELHLSTHTVKSHVHNALHKLGASNRAQGAAIVLGAGVPVAGASA